jgi:hypothetical protein
MAICLSAWAGWEVGIGEIEAILMRLANLLIFVLPRLVLVIGGALLLYWLTVGLVNWLRGD